MGLNLDQQHLTILDEFVGEVLPDVNMFGTFPSPHDMATPLDALSPDRWWFSRWVQVVTTCSHLSQDLTVGVGCSSGS
jgi:hypothetical protein